MTREPHPSDRAVVAAQLGREPRGEWRTGVCCRHGFPQTIVTAPVLPDGAPFPTLYWLTCPFLAEETARAESAGEVAAWARRLAADPALAARMRAADARYRALRAAEGDAGDPDLLAATGIAGQRDPLATKCLHAHVAAFLGGLDDPVGEALVARIGTACDDGRCGSLSCLREE